MNQFVVTTVEQLTTIIEDVVSKYLKPEKPKEPEQDRISGNKAAVDFLNGEGYEISPSLFSKEVAKGVIPCQRFHNKRLLFSKKELITWAESKCTPIGQSNATLILAKSARRKLK